ncbi:SAM-dependent methyltransferase [Actinosynnema sp. NPDC050801]|uniref:SAM-dependent methyltransferase n=1 Tax=unclassified Actinosynnema TaxID=2637065 RepID=UPI0033EBDAAD
MTSPEGVLFATAEDSYRAASLELKNAFGRQTDIKRVGPDEGMVVGLTAAQVAEACRNAEIVFIKHLTNQVAHVTGADQADPAAISRVAREVVSGLDLGDGHGLAVQAWASGSPRMGYTSGELFTAIAESLGEDGVRVGRAGEPVVLSCCITPEGVRLGVNTAADSLTDWPGGRVRLARDPAQVSRAEFKLEELFQVFPSDLPTGGRAVDLGASPGGWTRILRTKGFDVWAVDPGDLAPQLTGDRRVHHERTTAGEFFRRSNRAFDVVVNDMRMDPELSCEVMLDAATHLRPGAIAILTLKTGTYRPVEVVDRCRRLLRKRYDITFARQLHHNRHELTVVATRRA